MLADNKPVVIKLCEECSKKVWKIMDILKNFKTVCGNNYCNWFSISETIFTRWFKLMKTG